ncbi:MAG: tRNA (N6-isopentenyl adenosine(37)-C2)-methylthiotransferase MiaB [Patescibacteria group bacterium]|nr:tRNA (N6-isopentenyl adenosine(37)-C2)-methylthiotransferase MiaB [Patescibacteria group bacterium]
MKYYFFILGCQMNTADAERIAALLDSFGFDQTKKEKEADIIITLACSVRQKPIDRIYGKINKWNKEKKKRKILTILTGCLLTQDKKKLKNKFDIIFHIENLSKLPHLIKPFLLSRFNIPAPKIDYLDFPIKPISKATAYIPIMTGCNNHCTYCVVPFTRGPERSRKKENIIKEIKYRLKKGAKDIVLVGQNVNSFNHKKGKVYTDNKPFINLLKEVNKIKGDFWLHFISNHPKDMTPDLIRAITKIKKIPPYLHLPFQSGDNQILKKMNRHYTKEEYLKLVDFIKKTIPQVAITTDIIVGFPGETKQAFQNTVKVVKKSQFDMAYISQYSERSGTAAAKLKDNISKKEKKKREQRLTKLIEKSSLKNNKKLSGQKLKVLVSGQKGDYTFGRTNTWKVVKFKGKKNLIGKFVYVKITQAKPWKLEGKIK